MQIKEIFSPGYYNSNHETKLSKILIISGYYLIKSGLGLESRLSQEKIDISNTNRKGDIKYVASKDAKIINGNGIKKESISDPLLHYFKAGVHH